mmetsp:Transcript_97912/g.276991  ORF Transcript_97912/g.276991 Transcript_97912/m.276991 type:complete len:402 (+) Transcript_97912:46-1251(+)
MESVLGWGALPPQTHVIFVDSVVGRSLCHWAVASKGDCSVARSALASACPTQIKLCFGTHARIYRKCVALRSHPRRDEELGFLIGSLEQSLESFMLCWSALQRLQTLLHGVRDGMMHVLPPEDAPLFPSDEPPHPFDDRVRDFGKTLRAKELEDIASRGVDALLAEIEEFGRAAEELGCSWCDLSSSSARGHSSPMSTFERQRELANAMRDAKGFAYEFSSCCFPNADMLREARRRAVEADVLWNEWRPEKSHVAYVAIVVEEEEADAYSGPRVLKCIALGEEYKTMASDAEGYVRERRIIRRQCNGCSTAEYLTDDSDWASLVSAARGSPPDELDHRSRMTLESTSHASFSHAVDGLIPDLLGDWPLHGLASRALRVRAATTAEAFFLLRRASGLRVAGI